MQKHKDDLDPSQIKQLAEVQDSIRGRVYG